MSTTICSVPRFQTTRAESPGTLKEMSDAARGGASATVRGDKPVKRPTRFALGDDWNLDGGARDGRGPTADSVLSMVSGQAPTRDRSWPVAGRTSPDEPGHPYRIPG
ncbi:MAG TPA: hypothetical protein VFW03_00740 [Gemmatimonadaceae bacterium]|nr:hypothetical protein [Gemmatimonadaceae bacterium]